MPLMNKTEDRIIVAAGELFFRHGIKSITMDEIATHLGMSKKTIYQFYADKDAIVVALTELELSTQLQEMEELRKTAVNAIDEIFNMMSCLSRTFIKINANVFYDMQKFHPDSWKRFHEFKEKKMFGFVEENLKSGIRDKLYRSDVNAKIMAKFRMEEVAIAFNPAIFPPDKYNIKEVQMILLDHFVHGIATLKGHKLINKYKQVIEDE